MNITANTAASFALAPSSAKSAAPEAPKKELHIKQDQHDRADRFEDSRRFGNAVAGVVTGATVETLDATLKSPKLAWEIAENLWQADTIGPNLKFLGTLAALPAAALSIAAAPFHGAWTGASDMRAATRETKDVLPKDASAAYTNRKFNDKENLSMSSNFMKSLEALGDRKLEPGQKKTDVPLLSPVFSIVGGVVSAGISGIVGLVAGTAAGLLTTGKEIVGGLFGKDQTVGQRLGRIAAAPLHTVAVPYGLVKEGLKESVPRGFVDGWKHGPVKPVVETTKASVALAGSVLKEAWER